MFIVWNIGLFEAHDRSIKNEEGSAKFAWASNIQKYAEECATSYANEKFSSQFADLVRFLLANYLGQLFSQLRSRPLQDSLLF